MRFAPLTIHRGDGHVGTGDLPSVRPRVEVSPYRNWLVALCAGAAFACAASVIDAAWMFAILAQRVRGFPTRRMVENAYPFLTLATAAMTWVAAWMLTTEEPSAVRQRRLRANVLRLLVTVSFLASSAYVMLLLDSLGVLGGSGGWFSWFIQSIDILVIMLLYPHLLHIASRLELRGMRWRTAILCVGLLFSATLAAIPRDIIMNELALTRDQWRHFQNFRLAMQVLWSTLAALVLLRFAVTFFVEAKKEKDHGRA